MTAITATPELLNVVDEPKKPKTPKKAKKPRYARAKQAETAVTDVLALEQKSAVVSTDVEAPEYTIDELSAATQVSSRTIRFYQSKGALPRPAIKGRVAYYSQLHVERLGRIAKLQDQGLRIRAIRDLLARADKGELVIDEWLGFKAQLQAPWAEDSPLMLSEDALYELIGDRRQGLIGQLLRLKLVSVDRQTYTVRSPALLKLTMKLERAGVEMETAVEGARIMRKHLARAAGELTDHFLKHLNRAPVGERVESLRPAGLEAVQLIFAQEIERALRKRLESGKL